MPHEVMTEVRERLIDWDGRGISLLEMSHRSEPVRQVFAEAEADLRELLCVPEDYAVLFLQGGASLQFAQVPMNLAGPDDAADYLISGTWSKKAAQEASRECRVQIAASGEESGFVSVPDASTWSLSASAAYFHCAPNETISGVELPELPQVSAPLVVDMSSTILSRPLDVTRCDLIYAGAQKNIGPSGLCLVIARRELIERRMRPLPNILSYAAQDAAGSMLNTPPVFPVYVAGCVFRWLKRQGGLEAMEVATRARAGMLYEAIDSSDFYANPVAPEFRSLTNVPFTLADAGLDSVFLAEAEAAGLHYLEGHRSVGGMRASMYNAMPLAGVDALVAFMHDFAQRHGG